MAYTTINKGSDYFNTKLYTGNDTTNAITGVNFQPDLVWIKGRDSAYNHQLVDIIRGVNKPLRSNLSVAEATLSDSFNSFDSDGFTLGGDAETDNFNNSGQNYVAWNWLGGGTGVSNTDGSITSTVSANTTSGFSIVSWTGNGSNSTIGHGLSTAPKMIILKNRSQDSNWIVYNQNLSSYLWRLNLDSTSAETSTSGSEYWTAYPTSSVFSVGTNFRINGSSDNIIAYCFAEKKGFSKFSSYTGNGNADGTFAYLGFKPAFVLIKNISDNDDGWIMVDNKRSVYNPTYNYLTAQASTAEAGTDFPIDFCSNGFKIRSSDISYNQNSYTYIYMAFAEHPLVSSTGVPCTAR